MAADVSDDEDFRSELQRLSASFGIGVIQLDIEEPDSAAVIYSAEEKKVIDWDALNKLAELNNDVRDFLKRVTNDIKAEEIIKVYFDPVLDSGALVKTIARKT